MIKRKIPKNYNRVIAKKIIKVNLGSIKKKRKKNFIKS